jgi:hypothetical protein
MFEHRDDTRRTRRAGIRGTNPGLFAADEANDVGAANHGRVHYYTDAGIFLQECHLVPLSKPHFVPAKRPISLRMLDPHL